MREPGSSHRPEDCQACFAGLMPFASSSVDRLTRQAKALLVDLAPIGQTLAKPTTAWQDGVSAPKTGPAGVRRACGSHQAGHSRAQRGKSGVQRPELFAAAIRCEHLLVPEPGSAVPLEKVACVPGAH